MTTERIAELLAGPHQAILSVARLGKGPLAVPMSYRFVDGRFLFITPEDTLHSRLMIKRGRATMTVQEAVSDGLTVDQWYVIAEGPVSYTDEDPRPHVRAILAKDRGEGFADAWLDRISDPENERLAVLTPERLSGYETHSRLEA